MQVRGAGHLYLPKYGPREARRVSGVFWWKCGKVRLSTGCRTEADAQRWALERLVEMRRGHLVGAVAARLTYDDLERMLLDRWQAESRKGQQQAVARLRHLRRAFAGWAVDALTTDRLTAYSARRRAEGAAVATVNLELALIRRAFGIAREAGRLDRIPVIRRLPGALRRTGTIEAGDLDAILSRLPERYRAPIRFLHATGWREQEALRLTWSRVDLEAGEVRLDTSKTGAPRIVYLGGSPSLRALLESLWRSRREISPYVFPGRAGRPIDRTTLQKRWRVAAIAAGLPAALIHDLRRTMKRDLRRSGAEIGESMRILGHTDVRVHLGYDVVNRRDQEETLRRVELLRAGEPVQQRLLPFAG
jgi:integrase